MPQAPKQNRSDYVDSPTAWFAVLERARVIGDYELAATAQRELDRLGVTVKFGYPKRERAGREVVA